MPQLDIADNLRRGLRWTIESGQCAPEVWACDTFFPNKAEARKAAAELAREMGDPCGYVGRMRFLGLGDFNLASLAERIVESMADTACDMCGEAAEYWPEDDIEGLTPIVAALVETILRRSRPMVLVCHIEHVVAAE